MTKFTQSFCPYVGEGDSITTTVGRFTVRATIYRDNSNETPWDRSDGHGPVSDWTTRDKLPGERVLCEDHGSKRFYDYAEAIKIAKHDGWDTAPYGQGTKGERAARAVEADFKFLRDWCIDEWFYVGVAITVFIRGTKLTDQYAHALWGIESNAGDYLVEAANELLPEALEDAKARAEELLDELAEALEDVTPLS